MKFRAIRCLALWFLLLPLLVLSAYADSIIWERPAGIPCWRVSAVTNTGTTVLSGSLGVSPGCALSGAANDDRGGADELM